MNIQTIQEIGDDLGGARNIIIREPARDLLKSESVLKCMLIRN